MIDGKKREKERFGVYLHMECEKDATRRRKSRGERGKDGDR